MELLPTCPAALLLAAALVAAALICCCNACTRAIMLVASLLLLLLRASYSAWAMSCSRAWVLPGGAAKLLPRGLVLGFQSEAMLLPRTSAASCSAAARMSARGEAMPSPALP